MPRQAGDNAPPPPHRSTGPAAGRRYGASDRSEPAQDSSADRTTAPPATRLRAVVTWAPAFPPHVAPPVVGWTSNTTDPFASPKGPRAHTHRPDLRSRIAAPPWPTGSTPRAGRPPSSNASTSFARTGRTSTSAARAARSPAAWASRTRSAPPRPVRRVPSSSTPPAPLSPASRPARPTPTGPPPSWRSCGANCPASSSTAPARTPSTSSATGSSPSTTKRTGSRSPSPTVRPARSTWSSSPRDCAPAPDSWSSPRSTPCANSTSTSPI